jgi:hypothetical protein
MTPEKPLARQPQERPASITVKTDEHGVSWWVGLRPDEFYAKAREKAGAMNSTKMGRWHQLL